MWAHIGRSTPYRAQIERLVNPIFRPTHCQPSPRRTAAIDSNTRYAVCRSKPGSAELIVGIKLTASAASNSRVAMPTVSSVRWTGPTPSPCQMSETDRQLGIVASVTDLVEHGAEATTNQRTTSVECPIQCRRTERQAWTAQPGLPVECQPGRRDFAWWRFIPFRGWTMTVRRPVMVTGVPAGRRHGTQPG